MKQIMKAKWEATVECESGVKYTCDCCGKVIIDTTQIPNEFINRNPSQYYFALSTNSLSHNHLCSLECVNKMFENWAKDNSVISLNDNQDFEVKKMPINVRSLLSKYDERRAVTNIKLSDTISLKDWNGIKSKQSVPVEDDK